MLLMTHKLLPLIGNMELKNAVASLSALAQGTRLAAFRLLVRAGPAGLAAGAIADLTGAARDRAIDALRAMLADHLSQDRVALPASAWIVTARGD